MKKCVKGDGKNEKMVNAIGILRNQRISAYEHWNRGEDIEGIIKNIAGINVFIDALIDNQFQNELKQCIVKETECDVINVFKKGRAKKCQKKF